MSDTQALRARFDNLRGRYGLRFANKPRATRELGELDLLIKEGKALLQDASSLGVAGDLRTEISAEIDKYVEERAAIEEAQAAGSVYAEAATLGERANLFIGAYERHFSGQDRRTRDVGRLSEIVVHLEAAQRRMATLVASSGITELRKDLEVVTENLAVYRAEKDNIVAAQASGEGDQQASVLAHLANRQFSLYSAHFAGRSRLGRRGTMLERIRAELGRIGEGMARLTAQGQGGEANFKNAGIVVERRAMYETEIAAIQQAQTSAGLLGRLESLEREAAELMAEYDGDFAGQDRATRDGAQMALMCDKMHEIELQLTELHERYDLGDKAGKLGLVRDCLSMFQGELRAIQQARLH